MMRDEIWSRMKKIQRVHLFLYRIGLGPLIGKFILLLTTTGRKSGQKRITPLQYELIEGDYYLGSARGTRSDWFRNIQADARVSIRVKNLQFSRLARTVTDPEQIADFLEIRLQRHPLMIGLIMEKTHHLPRHPSREQLLSLASREALVIIPGGVDAEVGGENIEEMG